MISVSAVSYLNTKPFLLAIERAGIAHLFNITLEIPSKTAERLCNNEVDLALVPAGILPQLNNPHIVTNYCLGASGPVKTVCLYSYCPLPQIKTILLDYHSATSVRLVQILMRKYWQFYPEFLPAQPGFESEIKGDTAGVIIGDRAIGLDAVYPFVYDFATAWQQFTNLPFVFAVWASLKPLPKHIEQALNKAFALGLTLIPEVAEQFNTIYPLNFDIKTYLQQNISYAFDAPKQEALKLFLQWVKELKI